MDEVAQDVREIMQDLADGENLDELREDIESSLDETFNGFDIEEEYMEKFSSIYSELPEIVIKKLLDENWAVPAYMTLYAFVEEKVDGVLIQSLEEEPSNSEEGRITRVNLRTKIDILKTNGVIDEDTRNGLSEFISKRISLAHGASNHLYDEDEGEEFKRCFTRGLRAFDKLRVAHIESYSPSDADN